LSTGTVIDESSTLDEYLTLLQSKEQFYFAQLADMREQVMKISAEFNLKEEEQSLSIREAITAKEVIQTELTILSESHNRIVRHNAELEEKLALLQDQLSELCSQNDSLEAERIQAVTSLELPHPDILVDVVLAIVEREAAEASRHAALSNLTEAKLQLQQALADNAEVIGQLSHLTETIETLRAASDSERARFQQETADVRNQLEEKQGELAHLGKLIEEGLTDAAESLRDREALTEEVAQLKLQLIDAQEDLSNKEENLQQQRIQGKAQAAEFVASLQAEISQLRNELKTANLRLKASLEGSPTPPTELRKLQIETTELRLRIAELQASKENSNKRKGEGLSQEEAKNRRVSLDQEECRQQ